MSAVGQVIATVLWLYLVILIARLVVDFVQMMSRDWTPRGPVLVVCEIIYSMTDPPLRLLRRVIPPLRFGGIALDLSFIVLVLALQVATKFAMML